VSEANAKRKAPKTRKPAVRAEATPRAIRQAHRAGEHRRAAALVEAGKGSGTALPFAARRRLHAHLGHRFAEVRVHNGDFAARTARELDANAFTVGRDVFFATGRYAPEEPAGYARLAHEAAHTVQQRSTAGAVSSDRLEAEADRAVLAGGTGGLSATAPMILCEPTWPRRTTGAEMICEAERILTATRDPRSSDELTRLWSQVGSNFPAEQTAGTIARRVWTNLFLRHFTEPDPRGGVESVHPRYFYSKAHGWVDGQHFFGFIDFAEQHLAARPNDPDAAFAAATAQGIKIEDDQQKIRDYVILGAPPAQNPTWRLMQVRPPNTPLFRSPQMVAGAAAYQLAKIAAGALLTGTQRELFALLDESRRQKFFLDSAKSAWTYEDIVSDQLGTRFFFEHGTRINRMSPAAREPAMLAALTTFFREIGVLDNPAEVDRQARTDGLPLKEAYEAAKTTEERERRKHPDLFRRPKEAAQ
jgi:hypothetical protein